MNIHAAIAVPLGYEAIEKGLSARKVERLVHKGEIDAQDVYRAIPERTFKRRLADKAKLTIEEADAIARILRINALGRWAFDGDEEQARQFMAAANPALGNRIPRVMAATDAGAREVEALLYRFAAGDYS